MDGVQNSILKNGIEPLFEYGGLVSVLVILAIVLLYVVIKLAKAYRDDTKAMYAEVKGMSERTVDALHQNALAIKGLSVHLESRKS